MKNNQEIKVVADDYTIISDEKMVFALSNYNIPCEINKLPVDIRNKTNNFIQEIKSAVSLLQIGEDEILEAHYLDVPSKKKYHLENVLFYNLGSRIFKENCRNGLAFMVLDNMRCSELIQKFSIENRYTYGYLYECKKASESTSGIDDGKILADWKDVIIDEIEIKENKITEVWKSLKEQSDLVQIVEGENTKLEFGIEVQLSLPKQINVALYLKSIVDGIICAFHSEEGKTKSNIDKLYKSIGQSEMIFKKNYGVLGGKEYLRFYEDKSDFRWYPDGHRCRFFMITVNYGSSTAKFSGKIFKWGK